MKDFLGHEFDPYTQMNAFICKLAKADVPFQVIGFSSNTEGYRGTLSVLIPSVKSPLADFVCHGGSYGHEEGLMEVMVHDEDVISALGWDYLDPIKGYLDADEAFSLAKEILAAKEG